MTNDELKALCESNARAIQATNEGIGELKNTVTAFINRIDDQGLQVRLITEISDDQAGDLASLDEQAEDTDIRFNNLRADAITDRLEFRAQAEADRAAFKEEMAAEREETARRFDAQMEAMRSQLVEMSRINRRIDNLGQAG